jgi:hypothetical protein
MTPYNMYRYNIVQLDTHGNVLAEKPVSAQDYTAALRKLADVARDAKRIVVYYCEGKKAGEIDVDYWRHRVRRR